MVVRKPGLRVAGLACTLCHQCLPSTLALARHAMEEESTPCSREPVGGHSRSRGPRFWYRQLPLLILLGCLHPPDGTSSRIQERQARLQNGGEYSPSFTSDCSALCTAAMTALLESSTVSTHSRYPVHLGLHLQFNSLISSPWCVDGL